MAKKSTRNVRPQEVKAGPDPNAGKATGAGKSLGSIVGCACLLAFIVFDQLWLAIACCALAFAVLYAMQVFLEKSVSWSESPYLYVTLLVGALAFVEYQFGLISRIFNL